MTRFFVLLTLSFISSKALAQKTPSFIAIKLSESVKIPIISSDKVIIPKGGKISVTVVGKSIFIRGKAAGLTRISIGDKSLDVNILSSAQYVEYQSLMDLISNFKGLQIELAAPDITITGELLRASDWEDIIDLNIRNLNFRFKARVHQQALDSTMSMLRSYFIKRHFPVGDINLFGEPKIYFGSEPNIKVIAPTGLGIDINPTAISTAPMVRTQIVVASVKRSYTQSLGIKWPGSYSVQEFDENSLLLNALEAKGWGKILASPTLLCRSGKDSSFLAGGEFPIRLVGYKQRDVVWKSYGVLLKVKPLADYQGQMSINIETEVSSLDTSHMVDGIPAVNANRMNSHFDLTKTKTIALSGLINEQKGESREGLPFLSRVPILGKFFSSQDYKDEKSELVIFVTPKIVLPNDGGDHPDLPKGWENESL